MSVVGEVRSRLEQLEAQVAPEVRAIRLLLAPERQWIGTVEVQRLLGVRSINTVKAWAKLELLRSRRGPSGRLKVHLDDVLREAQAQRDLEAMSGIDAPEEANEVVRQVRQQLRDPAERERVDSELATAGLRFAPEQEPA